MGAFTAKANGVEHKNPKTDEKDDVVDEAEQNDPQEESGDNENDQEGSADGDRYPPTKRNPAAIAAFLDAPPSLSPTSLRSSGFARSARSFPRAPS